MKRLVVSIFLGWSILGMAQSSFTGTVIDETLKNPISGVHILHRERGAGVITDETGTFEIKGKPGDKAELILSHVGYCTDTVVITLSSAQKIQLEMRAWVTILPLIVVESTRASENAPLTFENLSRTELSRRDWGADIPIILEQSASVISSSDAGVGIGYTNLRIRGTDQTRINVTINGIPYNDPESHGVFWVNLPDLTQSASSIQIQRGVGTSTNGSGAFGATINIETQENRDEPYGSLTLGAGSFNTLRTTASFGTGWMEDRWSLSGRLSAISSDGYIDRASTDLQSYYLSARYRGKRMNMEYIQFAGDERTYQSWWGTPESRLKDDEEGMLAHAANNGLDSAQTANLLNSGRTYNYYEYENEVDQYGQDHYQLHTHWDLSALTRAAVALHYTRGLGYFEQYRADEDYANYQLAYPVLGGDTIIETDLIRRRWLDNHFYGTTFSFIRTRGKWHSILGGAWSRYDGEHYGTLVWMDVAGDARLNDRYYNGTSKKVDFNTYFKTTYETSMWLLFADLQYRQVDYAAKGIDNDLKAYAINERFQFFNPKLGATFRLSSYSNVYLSHAIANREPVRSDFIDAPEGTSPRSETLFNTELGYRWTSPVTQWSINAYHMFYTDQLVVTGELNDVGANVRTNIDRSFRAGIEASGSRTFGPRSRWEANANLNLSQNKIAEFTEVLYDYTNGFEMVENRYKNTPIALSPNVLASGGLGYRWFDGFHTQILARYAGRQFLDNTGNETRTIDPFQVMDAVISYSTAWFGSGKLECSIRVNNVLSAQYSTLGYTYSYIYGDLITENFFYPQAERNYMLQLRLSF